jgi:hypothetical protein
MPIFHRNKKPQPTRPPSDQTWRWPKPVMPVDHKGYEEEWGAFIEDAISDSDALMARIRSYGADHE